MLPSFRTVCENRETLATISLIALILLASLPANAQSNLLQNAGFESRIDAPWHLDATGGAAATVAQDVRSPHTGTASARIIISALPAVKENLQLRQNGVVFAQGSSYTVSFWSKAMRSRTITVVAEHDVAPFESEGLNQLVNLTTTWQQFSYTFTAGLDLSDGKIAFILGNDTQRVWLDDVALIGGASADDSTLRGGVDLTSKFQSITGFGASQAFFAAPLLALPQAQRDSVMDLLFSSNGAGLSMLRSQIEPQWDYASGIQNIDEDQYWIMREAQKRGVDKFFATPWSPPAEMKANGKAAPGVNDDPNNYLLPSKYADYAAHLSSYVSCYARRGIPVGWVSLQNEPDYNPAYNSCTYTPSQLRDLAIAVRSRFDADSLTAKIVAPECESWTSSVTYLQTIYASPAAQTAVSVVSTHGYGGNQQEGTLPALVGIGTSAPDIWQSEWCDLSATVTDDGIANGVLWAERLHTDLTVGQTSAWMYWQGVGFDSTANTGLLRCIGRRAPYNLTVPKRLWCVAQFSRFLRPGARRIAMSTVAPIEAVAFLSPSGDSLIVIAVNNTATAHTLVVGVAGSGGALSISRYRTSQTENLAMLTPLASTNDSLMDVLPPQTVTTFVVPYSTAANASPIAPWYRYKQAAVSLTFDDNSDNQFAYGLPMLNARGLPATYFVITGMLDHAARGTTWDTIRYAASFGHEIGSHSITHPSTTNSLLDLDSAARENELAASRATIEQQIGKRCETFAYPYVKYDNELEAAASRYYLSARGGGNILASATPPDMFNVGSYIPGTGLPIETMNGWIDGALAGGAWCVEMIHAINSGGFQPLPDSQYAHHFDYIASHANTLWVAPYRDVVKYVREREAAVFTPAIVVADSMTFELHDNLPDSSYHFPLTLHIALPPSWGSARVTQNGVPRWSTLWMATQTPQLRFEAVPDSGTIVITRTTTGVRNSPEALEKTMLVCSPNPARNEVTITWNTSMAGFEHLPASLELFDLLGRSMRRIFHGEVAGNDCRIATELNDIPNGTYVLRLVTPFESAVRVLEIAR